MQSKYLEENVQLWENKFALNLLSQKLLFCFSILILFIKKWMNENFPPLSQSIFAESAEFKKNDSFLYFNLSLDFLPD